MHYTILSMAGIWGSHLWAAGPLQEFFSNLTLFYTPTYNKHITWTTYGVLTQFWESL